MTEKTKAYTFSDLTKSNFSEVAAVQMLEDTPESIWHHVEQTPLDETEQVVMRYLLGKMQDGRVSVMNEATLWSRVNYPVLTLAETERIKAWSEISMEASLPHVTLKGDVDGVLGWTTSGLLELPYFVIVEAKRGIESKDPRYQLYGQLLATSSLNQNQLGQSEEADMTPPLYGCYIVAETWTFAKAQVANIASHYPTLHLMLSREYSIRFEMELIAKILKQITRLYA
ncbi:MAG: hypothetical protein AAF639_03110 [Chloroflexota bacterium]